MAEPVQRTFVIVPDSAEASERLAQCRPVTPSGGKRPRRGTSRRWVTGPVLAHELEPFDGITSVSRANQAAAFDRSSSRSPVVRPSARRPSSRSACVTQCGSPAPRARTPSPAPPACDRLESAQSSAGGTPPHRLPSRDRTSARGDYASILLQ